MEDKRTFPIQEYYGRCHGFSIPWSLIEPHHIRACLNHGGQSLERLAERGGLSPTEALAVLTERNWREVSLLSPFEACVEIGKILARREDQEKK